MLKTIKAEVRKALFEAIRSCFGADADAGDLHVDCPFDLGKGDLAVPLFPLSKVLKKSPRDIACMLAGEMGGERRPNFVDRVEADGGYVNFYLDVNALATAEDALIAKSGELFGSGDCLSDEKIMVEFSCPNTNKSLHLGHMRNDCIGSTVSRLLAKCSADVCRVNLVNDRGIHICKSMLAYEKFGSGKTPEGEGIKPDRFVADYYVLYNKYEEREGDRAKAEIAEMLRKWEAGDEKVMELWRKMRKWALDGINETYANTGIEFDRVYYESELYKFGREEVLKGLDKGIFYKDATGAVMVDIDGKPKVLLRSDGTTIYLTQDIATAIKRHEDYPYTSCVYVVGNEQADHFKVLFAVLEKLGFGWSRKLHHLSYGMVNLPDGRMKTREGTVVDADDLLASLSALSLEAMRDGDESPEEREAIARKVSLAALNYFLLSVSPGKDMVFDSKKSMSFSGDTGPYLQYTAARISSLLRKAEADSGVRTERFGGFSSLADSDERLMVMYVSEFAEIVEKAALSFDPSLVCMWAYGLCKVYSHYYHETEILKASEKERLERIRLSADVLAALKSAFAILGIPFVEKM